MLRDDPRSPEEKASAYRAGRSLQKALEKVEGARDAKRTMDVIERSAGGAREGEIAEAGPRETLKARAAKIEGAGEDGEPAAAILETARQAATGDTAADPVIDTAVERATGHSADAPPLSKRARRGRRLLREEAIQRMGPLDALDAEAYLLINHLPHPPWADRWMGRLTGIMTGGHGWLAVLALIAIIRPRDAGRAAGRTLPALWLTTAVVEYPIKRYCRRRRPFIDIVRAIVVGRKPGSYSFPSGHSAAAFAGAVLLGRCFPRLRRVFFAIAGLTAFSRVYLGAHYPGDVISGSLIGAMLSRTTQKFLSLGRSVPK